MIVDVLTEVITKNTNQTYSYSVPKQFEEHVAIGKKVLVPFGNRMVHGFIMQINNGETSNKLKDITKIIDEIPSLNKELLELGKYVSETSLCYLMSAYQAMLPIGIKANIKNNINNKEEKYLILKNKELAIKSLGSVQQKIIADLEKYSEVKSTNYNRSSVNALIDKNYIEEIKRQINRYQLDDIRKEEQKNLTKDQQKVVEAITSGHKIFLIHGVTGSGKTEVYLHIIKNVLKQNKTAIFLVPEISLTPQIVKEFTARFGKDIAILHSGLSDGEKYDEWQRIKNKEVKIVVGARSAIFAPLENLGVIIIDEEHSNTYKQSNNPRYHALSIAEFRSKYNNCPLILGSATPSMESYIRALKERYTLLELPNRINNLALPKVTIVDMKDEVKKNNIILSDILKSKIEEKLLRNEQVILFLNRRGYSPFVTCTSCGFTYKCPNCDVTLTFHKESRNLRCHYCGHATRLDETCPECHEKKLSLFGLGTEKLEEEINKIFPQANVIRMDADTTKRKNAHKNIINSFREGKYNILLGTQMITKGLDFPSVTLVGVINGDTSLNIPDFRSSENTFNLLCQVSGRAGRNELPGEVIIQTYNPDNYSINYAKEHDYKGFFYYELAMRKKLKYPPFYFIAMIKILSKDLRMCEDASNKIGEKLRRELSEENIILGPSASLFYKINNVYRFQCVVKYKNFDKIKNTLEDIQKHYEKNKDIAVEIDINPSMT